MPRIRKCCVGDCRNLRQDAILFKFPVNEKRLNVWLKCLSGVCDVANLTPSKNFVCIKHFEARFITSNSRLKSVAYPSLFNDDEIASGISSLKVKEPTEHLQEHSYSITGHNDHTYVKLETNKEVVSIQTPLQDITNRESVIPSTSTMTLTKSTPSTSTSDDMAKLSTKNIHKSKRPRLIESVRKLSPLNKRIYAEYKKAKAQLSFQKSAKKAIKFAKETSFEKVLAKMNSSALKFFKMQMRLCEKKNKGRRFTTEEKVIALSIMKQSPKCYRFLRKIFILPSKSTLNEMIAKLILNPGINPQVFNLLKKEINGWDPKKKICSIIFDEMALDTAVTYDKAKDCIHGFVELLEKKPDFANHALVFMIRGAVYKWQQPICFYFCRGATPAIEIKTILKRLVDSILQLGLSPVALISDQGSAFQSAMNSLKEDTRRIQILQNHNADGTIIISGVNLSIIYDPPHLIKGIRNNFLNKNIVLDGKVSQWQDIIDVYQTDCQHTESRLLHKLNDQCVLPDKIKKMKVKNCVRVLSKTVSSALSYTANFATYVDGRPVSPTLKNTAETVLFLDKLFDSVNGATTSDQKSRGKQLRKAVTEKSRHHEFWQEAIQKLEKMKFVDKDGVKKSVPSVKNFITTLKSFMRLWQFFKENNMKIMRPRYFNSDPIENFFGQVRAYNYRYNDPNCHNFICTFKSLLVTRLISFHNESFNCEDDSADPALKINLLFENSTSEQSRPRNFESILEQARRERINTHSRAYTAGWVVGKILKKTKCCECQDSLTSSESLDIHNWISHREFNEVEKRRLKYPSEGAVRCFSTVVTETNEYLEKNPHFDDISSNIRRIVLSKYSFEFFNCAEHKAPVLNNFINIVATFAIFNWCNTINKIIKGTDVNRIINVSNLPNMQNKALQAFKKKLKNKSFNK